MRNFIYLIFAIIVWLTGQISVLGILLIGSNHIHPNWGYLFGLTYGSFILYGSCKFYYWLKNDN